MVGYAIGYPITVALTIVACIVVFRLGAARPLPERPGEDPAVRRQVALVVLLTSFTHAALIILGVRYVARFGTARTLGVLTGSQLQSRSVCVCVRTDARPADRQGYALLFPVIMVAKVLIAQVMAVFL